MQKDGRVLYLTEAEKENLYYNIPIANTTCILLGTGTSITCCHADVVASGGIGGVLWRWQGQANHAVETVVEHALGPVAQVVALRRSCTITGWSLRTA